MAKRLRDFEAMLDQVFPAHQTRVFRQLIEQVVVGKTDMTVRVSAKGIFDLMLELLDGRYLAELRREQTGSAAE